MKDQKKVDRIFLVIFDATVFLTAAFSIWFLIDPSGITEFLYGDMHPLGDLVMTLMFLPAFYLFFVIPLLWVELVAYRAVKYFGFPQGDRTKAETPLKLVSIIAAALLAAEILIVVLGHIVPLGFADGIYRFVPVLLLIGFSCEFACALIAKRRRAKEREGEQE